MFLSSQSQTVSPEGRDRKLLGPGCGDQRNNDKIASISQSYQLT